MRNAWPWIVLLIVTIVTVLCASCDKNPWEEGAPPVETVEVLPANLKTSFASGVSAEVQYTARITRNNGDVDETTNVAWDSTNISLGAVDESGLYTSSGVAGGMTLVKATYMGVTGSAELTLIFAEDVVENDLPAEVADLFDEDPDVGAEDAPRIIYPYDQVKLPRNTAGITFMWEPGPICNLYRLSFRSALAEVDVYTDGIEWTPSDLLWFVIATVNVGTETVVELTGISYHMDGNTPVADSVPMTAGSQVMHISRLDATGSVYYWNSSNSGIYRIPFGGAYPEEFLGENSVNRCLSCHGVTDDGTLMHVTWAEDEMLGIVDMDDPLNEDEAPINYDDQIRGTFSTFSPDGSLLLSVWQGVLSVRSAEDGEWLYDVDLDVLASHPDWSPRGDYITVAIPRSEQTYTMDYRFTEGQIALLEVSEDGTISTEPIILVESEDMENNYYPAFSPDGEWIAYNHSYCSDGTAETFNSYDDPSAQIRVISVDGTRHFDLPATNGEGLWTNSWSGWAPLPDADVLWLTFASKRSYGHITNLEDGTPQIWVAAFDPEIAYGDDEEADPASPPFWLPYQDHTTHNHIPVWSVD